MANSIIMPKTGMAMEEGVIIEWRVNAGDSVKKGDVVALIETDKSTMELESDYDGVILAILGKAGETVPVTRVIAWVGKAGESVPADAAPAAKPAASPAPETSAPAVSGVSGAAGIRATPAARSLAKERGIDLASLAAGGRYGEIRRADVESVAPAASATPLAKRIAAAEGISLDGVRGSGFGGKILKQDLAAGGASRAGEGRADTRVPLTNIQRITGKRMSESRQTIPEVTADIKADVTDMLEIRSRLNAELEANGIGVKLTINDFVLAAVVKALLLNPRVNSVLDGNELVYKGSVNLGMAVATGRGLVVPVIRDAQNDGILGLSSRAAALAAKAREGKLAPDEMAGGTFTVSNIGMYGVTSFTPIINPPEAAILGVCAIGEELRLRGETVIGRKMM
ncbi:MAG: 2-oxo acid dehydrogenase subunit E2, partial [Treponema sp.]|nr:2-oxo acid dehydrogenase subunit E2 [Treponema sp.]